MFIKLYISSPRQISRWLVLFVSVVLQAANYLDIKSLLDILCRAIADIIKGRDPQEIRKAFHVHDATPLLQDPPPTPPLSLSSQAPSVEEEPQMAQSSSSASQD